MNDWDLKNITFDVIIFINISLFYIINERSQSQLV